MSNDIYTDHKHLADKMGVDPKDVPEEEVEQPEDVAEVEVIEYGNGE